MNLLSNSDLFTCIITSDFQIRTRWCWTGFQNQYWEKSCVPDILYPNARVDVDHRNGKTISGYILDLEFLTCGDFRRLQADWKEPREMDCVVATMWTFAGTRARSKMRSLLKKKLPIAISIEHTGRKPKKKIGPYVTITDTPMNKDCWVIQGNIDGKFYPNIYPKKKFLPESVSVSSEAQYAKWHSLLSNVEEEDLFHRGLKEAWEPGGDFHNLYLKRTRVTK